MCISPAISSISPIPILYTPIHEINSMFHTKQSFSHNNLFIIYLHYYY